MNTEDMRKNLVDVEKKSWRGNLYGVRIEIVEWSYEGSFSPPTWNYYLHVYEDQVPPTNWPRYWISGNEPNDFGRVYYPLHKTFFNDLWWPGGAEVSYYRKITGGQSHGDREGNCVKFGCAYMCEAWKPTVIDDAIEDVCRTIEDLREVEPDLKYICDYCAGFFHGSEGRSLGAEWYCHEHHLDVSVARNVGME